MNTLRRLPPLLSCFLIVLVALLACAPLLRYGAIGGHDLEFHLIWIRHFTAALAQGVVYPRWLMDMNLGAGSPTFYYYPPMAYYLSAIPGLLSPGIALATQHAIAETLIVAFSGLSFHRYARRRFSGAAALSGALLYMLLPYHYVVDLWTRQDLSELANYLWLPLVLGYAERVLDGEDAMAGLAIVYAGMVFTHPPTTLLFSLGLAGYVLTWIAIRKDARRFVGRILAAMILGALLSAIYWMPAVFGQQYIHAEEWWTPRHDFHAWFFLHPEIVHGDRYAEIFMAHLFDALCATVAIFAAGFLNALRRRDAVPPDRLWPVFVLAAISVFFMSSWSRGVWEMLPVLWKVQFPWRFAMLLDLAAAIAVTWVIQALCLRRDALTPLLPPVVAGLLLFSLATADVRYMSPPDDAGAQARRQVREDVLAESRDAPAHMPRWWNEQGDRTQAEASGPMRDILERHAARDAGWKVAVDEASGRIAMVTWRPQGITLDVDLRQPAPLVLRQLYFPNWRARIEGSGVLLPTAPLPGWGLLRVDAPAGKYRLHVIMQPLREALPGAILSGIALLWLCGRVLWRFWRRRFAPGG